MAREMRRVGIIGAGQLGRMLALAGYPLGLRFVFLDRSEDAPGGQVGEIVIGGFDEPERIAELARRVDVLTFDVENVPSEAVRPSAEHTPFYPPVAALDAAQDRFDEKTLFRAQGIPTPDFRRVDSLRELQAAVKAIGLPAVLKTRRLGYDGKGQRLLREESDLEPAWEAIGGVPLILEAFVDFEREVSVIGVRGPDGEIAFYPIAHNVHEAGILHHSFAPYEDVDLQQQAEQHCRRLMEHLGYVGVLTIEFFVVDGELIANEMAPRVHNSGHWTIEGAVTSQFENHVRAILGLPLGDTSPVGHSGMVNFLGELPPLANVLRVPGAHYHDYGKEPRPGRKLGHCTVVSPDPEKRDSAVRALIGGEG